ncbi:MAG TPA: amylo-alpha-1,6-glucosidase, partial [Bacteroidota bacterium]|nr:amylo-alpha-1,6-glucosidase [Bacteroidota bacterium]
YILTTVQDGLVRCYADGTNVWGICSWRNIIDDYNLTGAVTEVNAECYYALAIAAASALALGFDADAQRFRSASESLKDSINAKLLSPSTGMYLLNLDNGGTAHHDITGDEIFPVFFETATPQVRNRILLKLTEQEMWTPYGSRTVHPAEKNYDPDFGYQLVGGVWHNLTAWIAYCSRHERPRLVKEALINIYRLAETEKPNEFENVVPGEFPERLHGETYHSRGMTMSPWMPPTYLWLGVEGLLGVKPGLDAFEMNPALPPDWNWLAVRNLPYRGASLSAFVFDGKLYCSSAVVSELPTVVGKLVYSSADDDGIYSFALKVGNEILLFVACDHGVSGVVSVGSGEGTIKQQVQLAGGEARMLPLPAGSLAPAGAVQTTVA